MTKLPLALRYGYGAVLLIMPKQLARLASASLDRRTRTVARLLGGRELLQAELLRRCPGPECQRVGAGVDAVHAASMVAVAAVDRPRRRLVLHNAATSSAFALACLAAARRAT